MSLLVRGSYTYPAKPGQKSPATERIFRFEATGLDPVTKNVMTTEKLVVEIQMQCVKNPWAYFAPCAVTNVVNNTGVDVSGPKPESGMALDHNTRKALAEWEARKGQVAELDLLSGIAPIVVPGPGQVFATKDGWIQLGPAPPKGVGIYELEWESALLHAGKMYFRPQPGILDKLAAGQGHRVTFPQEGRSRVRAVNPTWWTRGEWREFWVGATRERALVEYGKEFTRRFQVRRASPAPSRVPAPVVPPPPRAR